MTPRPSYLRIALTFARNSLIRNMMFPANFIIESISSICWMLMNLGFYLIVFNYTPMLGTGDDGWGKYQFFVFLATTMFINSAVQMFFMPNAEEFSEMIRTGNLDFALLKPVDTQFLISLQRIDWSSAADFVVALVLLLYAVPRIDTAGFALTWWVVLLYPLYIVLGTLIMYSVMVTLSATSVWLGRNQTLYDFWFYITNFSRYPLEIYDGPVGIWLRRAFLFVVPVLVVVNVPARLLAKPFYPDYWYLAVYAFAAAIFCLFASRWIFQRALASYRSASS